MKASCILIILRRVMNHGKDSQERNQPPRNWDTGRMCVCVCVFVCVCVVCVCVCVYYVTTRQMISCFINCEL